MDLMCIIFDLHCTAMRFEWSFSDHAARDMLTFEGCNGRIVTSSPVAGRVQYSSQSDYLFAGTADH
jgi:hypothetical protein